MSASGWRVFTIGVDGEAGRVADKIEELYGIKVTRIQPHPIVLCPDKDKLVNELERAGIPRNYHSDGKKHLFIGGDGNYHHLTYALTMLSGMNGFGVFDADAHTDDHWYIMRKASNIVNCENFAGRLMEECGATSITYFGVGHEPNQNGPEIRWLQKDDPRMNETKEATVKELLNRVHEEKMYATIDLDVLDAKENIRVNPMYEREGSMELEGLIASINAVKENKELFAADICGHKLWGPPGNEKERMMIEKSTIAVSLIAGEIMGLDTAGARDVLKRIDSEMKCLEERRIGGSSGK